MMTPMFRGDHRNWCGNEAPHAPHRTDTYHTVRWGMLDRFCLGVEKIVRKYQEYEYSVEGIRYILVAGSEYEPDYLWRA
jgi:hypothetical protein